MTSFDQQRRGRGFLTVDELAQLATAHGVTVLDPHSTLVATRATLGAGVVLYPGVVLETDASGRIDVGEETVLHPGTLVLATDGGTVEIGRACQLGPGGAQVKANQPTARIVVGDGCRLLNGCELVGRSVLGAGCQILGPIAAQSVTLGGGTGGATHPDPDQRGAVLKGAGLARGLEIGRGEVVSLTVSFADAPVERQLSYHPRPTPE